MASVMEVIQTGQNFWTFMNYISKDADWLDLLKFESLGRIMGPSQAFEGISQVLVHGSTFITGVYKEQTS